jgi:Fe-S-cluster containining protein
MLNFEYMRLRHVANQNNETISSDHPCRRGCSACCTKEVPLSRMDAQHIQKAVTSGAIPLEVVEMAKEKASTKSRSCPFLEEGSCTVYEYRPILCAMTGAGGVPHSKKQLEQLNRGEVEGLPVRDLSSSMCKEGHTILANSGTFFTAQALEDTQDILIHLARNKFGSTGQLAKWLTAPKNR